jgi:hypothetical protein
VTIRIRTVTTVFVLVSLLASACSIGSLSSAEYASALGEATDEYIQESQDVSATFHSTVEDRIKVLAESGEGDVVALATDMTRRETVQYLAVLENAMSRYAEALTSMSPPGNLVDTHDAYVEAIDAVTSSMPATRARVGEASDLTGIQTAITGSGFSDGQLRLRAACSSLEAAVRQEGHGVDLGCSRPLR